MKQYIILWRIDPFLGSDRESNTETISVARQQLINKHEFKAAAREQLGKHVPVATDARMNVVLYVGCAEQL
jgi:hypothetical protein